MQLYYQNGEDIIFFKNSDNQTRIKYQTPTATAVPKPVEEGVATLRSYFGVTARPRGAFGNQHVGPSAL
jgi:hypothetical protein